MKTATYKMEEIVNSLTDLGYTVEKSSEGKRYSTGLGIEFPYIKFSNSNVIKDHGVPKDWEYFDHDKAIRFIANPEVDFISMERMKAYALDMLYKWLDKIQARIYYCYE